jgi:hypothetical protein
MQEPGSSFLHDRNPKLHVSQEVEGVVDYLRTGGEVIPHEPTAKISAYLGFLSNQEYVNDGIVTGDPDNLDHQIAAHVIDAADIPENYFALQRRIAREQGHGDIEIDNKARTGYADVLKRDQRASLEGWADYLTGDAKDVFPGWFKDYVFSSIVWLGDYNKRKGIFNDRTQGTVAAFPDINREALALVWDKVSAKADVLAARETDKRLPKQQRGKRFEGLTQDEKAERIAREQAVLAHTSSFNKLYSAAMQEAVSGYPTPEELETTKGSWRTFQQSQDPDNVKTLMDALRGRGTGWCTSGQGYAETQLAAGGFIIYFTEDQYGEERVPRIAIRMQDGEVSEVRGIVGGGDGAGPAQNTNQELEDSMLDIATEKLTGLPGGEAYTGKVQDMKRLTALEKKITATPGIELSPADIRFLYQIDREIQHFGYREDPRVKEIIAMRSGKDKPEVERLLPESIREQVGIAFTAYQAVAEQLGGAQSRFRKHEVKLSPDKFQKLFAAKDKEWRKNGVYDYLIEQLAENGNRFNLLATPNVAISEAQLAALAESFGTEQPHSTFMHPHIYQAGAYDDHARSGNSGRAPVRFSLVSNKLDSQMNDKLVAKQVRILQERQARHEALNIRVPSMLDAVTYWYSLRARGDKLNDYGAKERSYFCHFDLEPTELEPTELGSTMSRKPSKLVPDAYVRTNGQPRLSGAFIDRGGGKARLAIG